MKWVKQSFAYTLRKRDGEDQTKQSFVRDSLCQINYDAYKRPSMIDNKLAGEYFLSCIPISSRYQSQRYMESVLDITTKSTTLLAFLIPIFARFLNNNYAGGKKNQLH